MPSDQDILRSRVKSTGITEVQLTIHGTIYRMCDVGGQRSERKKWVHCFSDVEVLLFVLAISEFNQMLYEDESVSRIAEATTLWQSVSNSKWFANASTILFLNKVRLLLPPRLPPSSSLSLLFDAPASVLSRLVPSSSPSPLRS